MLLVIPGLKPVYLHNLPGFCPIIPCNWQDRGAHNLSFTSLDQLFQGTLRSLLVVCSLFVGTLCCLPGKPVEGNNQWAVPGWEAPPWCPLPGLQGANRPPVYWVQWAYQTAQKGISNNHCSSFFVNWEDCDDCFYQSISSSESPVLHSGSTSSLSSTTGMSRSSAWWHLMLLLMLSLLPSGSSTRLCHSLEPETWTISCFCGCSIWVTRPFLHHFDFMVYLFLSLLLWLQ